MCSVSRVLTSTLFAILVSVNPVFAKTPQPEVKVVQENLYEVGNFYLVKGSVYNPSTRAFKNVVINYYVWKKWKGQEGHGSVIRDSGGLVTATVKYLPPKQTVEFSATGNDNAPVMTAESGLRPDTLKAEISAEWDN